MSETKKNSDEQYMQRCLQLAALGLGSVSTNPLVGCVIVYEDEIIGEGYHQKYGEAHAEVNAIESVTNNEKLKDSTLYVNLEPCAHYGKTPPCADLITKHSIRRVVIGTVDTFSKVAGKGIEKLKNAGIDVSVGVLEQECREINKRFFTYNEKERSYIILKWAQTQDGFIGRADEDKDKTKRISNPYVDVEVHKWRAEEDAILVGTKTAIEDNPKLTTRLWEGKNPIRVVLDGELEVLASHAIFSNDAKTICVNNIKTEQVGNVYYEKADTKNLTAVLKVLYKHKIQSVIVEGGAKVLTSFINEGLWDEARIINAESTWQKGVKAPKLEGEKMKETKIEGNTITYYIH